MFAQCPNLTEVSIPSTFVNCVGRPWGNDPDSINISKVNLAEGMQSIPSYLLYNIMDMKSITLPSTITSIGGHAFEYCKGLKSVTIPEGVTSIGYDAFSGCSLVSITIPESVMNIGEYAFAFNPSLSVTINSSTVSIGERAFGYCGKISSININGNITLTGYYQIFDSVGKDVNNTVATIGNGVNALPDCLFKECYGLKEVRMSNTVTSIGNRIFENCNNLDY